MTADLQWYPLAGSSMWPLTSPWQAGVRPVAVGQLQPGDVVAFVAPKAGRAWFHRVVAIDDRGIHSRGDTNAHLDAPWPAEALLGRVEALRFHGLTISIPPIGWRVGAWRAAGRWWSRLAPRLRTVADRAVGRRE